MIKYFYKTITSMPLAEKAHIAILRVNIRERVVMNEFYIKDIGTYLRYQDFPGERAPMLFIHGLGCAGSFDYPQVATQQKLAGHRIILVDLLGAGYSDKPTNFKYSVDAHAQYLKDFVDYLELNDIILFGHSLGGPVAIDLAKMCEDKVNQLILSESNLDPSVEGSTSYKIAQFSERYFVKEGFREIIQECKQNGNTMWAATLSNWEPLAAYRFSKSGVQGGKLSWRKMLYDLPMKKSFIFGENSLPDDDFDELKRHGIYVEIVKNAGHSMAWENPAGLAHVILQCLAAP